MVDREVYDLTHKLLDRLEDHGVPVTETEIAYARTVATEMTVMLSDMTNFFGVTDEEDD